MTNTGQLIAPHRWLTAQVFVPRYWMWFARPMRHTPHLNAVSSHTAGSRQSQSHHGFCLAVPSQIAAQNVHLLCPFCPWRNPRHENQGVTVVGTRWVHVVQPTCSGTCCQGTMWPCSHNEAERRRVGSVSCCGWVWGTIPARLDASFQSVLFSEELSLNF